MELAVEGIACGGCIARIEGALKRMPGVVEARVNFTNRRLTVAWIKEAISPGAVIEALDKMGYGARPFAPRLAEDEDARAARELMKCLATAGFAAMNIMLLSVSVWSGNITDITPETRDFFHWLSALIAVPAVAYAGRPFLRSALGIQQTPPNSVLIGLALFLTVFIMMPTLQAVYDKAIQPLVAEQVTEMEALDLAAVPVRDFMLGHVREQDLKLFLDMAKTGPIAKPDDTPLRALIPAFMISELRRAFEIGFLLFLPFIIIDMVVASVLMSMGMLMLPPIMISLPFKLIFFVLVDGWYLVAGSLVQSYGG